MPAFERQEVGLEGDIVDHFDDLLDLAGGGLDASHGGDGVGDDRRRTVGAPLGMRHGLVRLVRPLRRGAHRHGDLVDGRRRLLERSGLSLCPLRQGVGGPMHVRATLLDRLGIGANLRQRILKAEERSVEIQPQLFETAGEGHFDLPRQVALCQASETGCEFAHGKIDLSGRARASRHRCGCARLRRGHALRRFPPRCAPWRAHFP